MKRLSLLAVVWVLVGSAFAQAQPNLTAVLEVPRAVPVGKSFTINSRFGNTGTGRAEDVRFYLDVPSSHFGTIIQEEEMVNRIEGDALKPGQEVSLSYTTLARVPGEQTITFSVTAVGGRKATATAKVRVVAPKLQVKIEGPAEVAVGKTVQFVATVANTGDAPAEGVNVTTELPDHFARNLTAVGTNAADLDVPIKSPAVLMTPNVTLKPGEYGVVTIVATAVKPGSVVYKFGVAGKGGVKAAAEFRTAVVAPRPGIHFEVVDSVDPVRAGGETVYEVKVKNTGTAADRNLKLVCELPAGATLVSATGPAPYLERIGIDFNLPGPQRTTSTVTFELVAELKPGAEIAFKVKMQAGTAGVGKFKATLGSDHLATPVTKEEPTTVYRD